MDMQSAYMSPVERNNVIHMHPAFSREYVNSIDSFVVSPTRSTLPTKGAMTGGLSICFSRILLSPTTGLLGCLAKVFLPI